MDNPIQQLKRTLKRVVKKGHDGIFFGIDQQPDLLEWTIHRKESWEHANSVSPESPTSVQLSSPPRDKHETGESVEAAPKNILSGWCFSIDGLVTLQLEINGQVVFASRPWLVRPDVHGMHSGVGESLCSGFSFSFVPELLAKIGSGKVIIKAVVKSKEHILWSWSVGVPGMDEPEAIAELSSWFTRLAHDFRGLLPAESVAEDRVALVVLASLLDDADFRKELEALVAKHATYSLYILGDSEQLPLGQRVQVVHSKSDLSVALQVQQLERICFIGTKTLSIVEVVKHLHQTMKKHRLHFLQPLFIGGKAALPAPLSPSPEQLGISLKSVADSLLATTSLAGPLWIASRYYVASTVLNDFPTQAALDIPCHCLLSSVVELGKDQVAPYNLVERHQLTAALNIHGKSLPLGQQPVYVLVNEDLVQTQHYGAGLQLARTLRELEKSGHSIVVLSNAQQNDCGNGHRWSKFAEYFVLEFNQFTALTRGLPSGVVLCASVSMFSEAFTIAYLT
ncbi:MAG: hypothetical protein KDD62_11455, partial [Bdellovibrionales bacterium]|nr:hypothetical protein [Bdellovibrionales bacterium]